jgi:Ykl077w/Psg1 (Pma1 Stabilization in Golgi)
VTWDSSFFRNNETLLIQANYVNTAGGGPQAFQSSLTSNSWGHIAWTIQRDWLKSQAFNNISLFISTASGTTVSGPVVMVTTSPITYATQAPTPVPSGLTLYIALPATLGFIVLCVCGGYILNRKHRQIGLGNIMGRRTGYGIGKSHRQRLGLSRKDKAGAIALRDHDLAATADGEAGVYRDVPVRRETSLPQHRRTDSDTLGSLAGTPTEDRPRGVNLFREELRRQERERQ